MADVGQDQGVHGRAAVTGGNGGRRDRSLLAVVPVVDDAAVALAAFGRAEPAEVVVRAVHGDDGLAAGLVVAVGGWGAGFATCHRGGASEESGSTTGLLGLAALPTAGRYA